MTHVMVGPLALWFSLNQLIGFRVLGDRLWVRPKPPGPNRRVTHHIKLLLSHPGSVLLTEDSFHKEWYNLIRHYIGGIE